MMAAHLEPRAEDVEQFLALTEFALTKDLVIKRLKVYWTKDVSLNRADLSRAIITTWSKLLANTSRILHLPR